MDTTRLNDGRTAWRKLTAVLLATAAVALGVSSPANADPQGYIPVPFGVGFFYGTFDESPNLQLVVGGTAEDFCAANPDDPFGGAEPGVAPGRIYLRDDGSVDIKVNDKHQPVHIYSTDIGDAPVWINAVCAGDIEADLFASGTADLKVRISVISEDLVDVFNSVNGKVTGTDGTEYKVRAWADLVVENGMPVGDPSDFVGFELHEIGG